MLLRLLSSFLETYPGMYISEQFFLSSYHNLGHRIPHTAHCFIARVPVSKRF